MNKKVKELKLPKESDKKPYLFNPQSGLTPAKFAKIHAVKQDRKVLKAPLGVVRKVEGFMPYTEFTVATGNYDTSRTPIKTVVIHTTVCCWGPAVNRFSTPNAQASAHYIVKLDGSILFGLEEYYTAYHAGNYTVNQNSIGIEHEDCGDYNGPRTAALYTTSAKLVRDICQFYGLPINRTTIRKHTEVSQLGTACPDSLDIERIVREAASGSPTPTPTTVDYKKIVDESKKYVFGYQVEGTVTQRMAKTIDVYKKYGVTKA